MGSFSPQSVDSGTVNSTVFSHLPVNAAELGLNTSSETNRCLFEDLGCTTEAIYRHSDQNTTLGTSRHALQGQEKHETSEEQETVRHRKANMLCWAKIFRPKQRWLCEGKARLSGKSFMLSLNKCIVQEKETRIQIVYSCIFQFSKVNVNFLIYTLPL